MLSLFSFQGTRVLFSIIFTVSRGDISYPNTLIHFSQQIFLLINFSIYQYEPF
jgi:hypothetical protein